MTGRTLVLLLAAALATTAAVPAGAQQQEVALYMTAETGDAAGQSGVRLLSPVQPDNETQSEQVGVGGESLLSWYTSFAFPEDTEVAGDATVVLYFGTGLDVDSNVTVTLSAVGGAGDAELGSASLEAAAGGAPGSDTFTLATTGAVIREGSFLRLDVAVSGNVVTTLEYGSSDAPSGITGLPLRLLDSDGDGTGDSAERRAGSDPDDADSTPSDPGGSENGTAQNETTGGQTPGQGEQGGDGATDADDGAPIEALLGAFLLLICLALAGFALQRRFA